jgi:hypothetical protein
MKRLYALSSVKIYDFPIDTNMLAKVLSETLFSTYYKHSQSVYIS